MSTYKNTLNKTNPEGTPKTVIIGFLLGSAEQITDSDYPVKRVTGFVPAHYIIRLISVIDLGSNPRESKRNSVTAAIEAVLGETPEDFPFMSKGILIGTTQYERLDRRRYRLTFDDPDIEGVLDGGHNLLAIGRHVLNKSGIARGLKRKPVKVGTGIIRDLSGIKIWRDLQAVWQDNIMAIEHILKDKDNNKEALGFNVPVEIVIPTDPKNSEIRKEYRARLLNICSARNNNVSLPPQASAGQEELYADLRKFLDKRNLASEIEWKPNDGGRIPVRDITALAWIPLLKIEDYLRKTKGFSGLNVRPVQIYGGKAHTSKAYIQIMEDDKFTKKADEGGYKRELIDPVIKSALKITADLPQLYDWIYKNFPRAYNDISPGFGGIKGVEGGTIDDHKDKYETKFYREKTNYTYAEGFVVPLLYGICMRLLEQDEEGLLYWNQEPRDYLKDNDKVNFKSLVKRYMGAIKAFNHDPQKVGKGEVSYTILAPDDSV